MIRTRLLLMAASALWLSAAPNRGEVRVIGEHMPNETATAAFTFRRVPPPSSTDAGTRAKFSLVSGERDGNGGGLEKLNDGRLPSDDDEPAENFFFNAGSAGGRLRADLGSLTEIVRVNTYSWHPGSRGPQVYRLFASDGAADGFEAQPGVSVDPAACGWKLLATVDTRPKQGDGGGQHGASIADSEGSLGRFRYLLFDCARTESDDPFGNTFYSELDIVGAGDPTNSPAASMAAKPFVIRSADDYCEITIDTGGAPELNDWAGQKLAPMLAEWYPKLTRLLASDGFIPPAKFSVVIRPGRGVAATSGTRITANATWLKGELEREALGALLHEEVHVVQQYRGRRGDPDYRPAPGWLVEGIPDYIRWFLFEPQSHGADLVWLRRQRNVTLRHDAAYRMSANFLNYVIERHDKDRQLITRLSAACRQGRSLDDIWSACTGKTLAELSAEWKSATEKELAAPR